MHAVFGALSLLALLIRKPRFHEIVTPLGALVMGACIALLFARLA